MNNTVNAILENLNENKLNESLKWYTPSVNWYGGRNSGDANGVKEIDVGINDDFSLSVVNDEGKYVLIALLKDPNGLTYQLESNQYNTQDEAKRKAEEAYRKYKKGITAKAFKSANSSIFTHMDDGEDY